MGMAINAVKEDQADAALSGGNTGALMAMAKLALRTMPGIDRPALAALLPTLGDTDMIMLDLGANTECDAQNLVQFAVMGAAYARTVLDIAKPRVKLLNIGTEELKGTDELKDAAALLREADYLPFRFDGFTEGDQLSRGEVDVVVTDGFSGNIALKTAEGTARFVTDLLRRAFKSSLRSKAGFALSRPALNLLKHHLDPNNHNGAVFLGLNGLVVKSHGSANAEGRRQRDRCRRADGPQRHHPEDRRRPRQLPRPRFRQRGGAVSVRSVVLGVGSALPARKVTNDELAETVDTTDAVDHRANRHSQPLHRRRRRDDRDPRHRRRAQGARRTPASTRCDIDLIVLATATPDQTFPSSATKVQAALGINDCIAFDVHAVCTGFLYALSVADSMLRGGNAKKALVIGAETFSRILDWEDRATCVLFGDGAGALVLGAEDTEGGILATKLHADGRHNDLLFVDGGPSTTGTVGKLRMKGREVFRHAVVNLAGVLNEVLDSRGAHRGRRGLGRAASGQRPNPRCDGPETGPPAGEGGRHGRPACQHVGGVGSAGVRHGDQGRPHQARRHCRAGSDGWRIYLGRGSAQVLKKLEYPAKVELPTRPKSVTKV